MNGRGNRSPIRSVGGGGVGAIAKAAVAKGDGDVALDGG